MSSPMRTRWAAIGAAVAVTLGAGSVGLVVATSPAGAATFVPIEPCRLVDTRPAPNTVGNKTSPVGPEETLVVSAHGDNGQCTGVPVSATGLVLNITAVGATELTFVTVWGDGERPNASHLNPAPGQPPTPNAVTTDLTNDGEFNMYNRSGSVNLLADIVGYYTDHHHDDRYYTEAQVNAALADKQDACAEGTALAFAQIEGSSLPDTLTDVGGFNCTGGAVRAARVAAGSYRIRFENLPVAAPIDGLVVQVSVVLGNGGTVAGYGSMSTDGTRDLTVRLYSNVGGDVDRTFSVSLFDPGTIPL